MNAPSTSTQLANPFNAWFEQHEKLGGKSLMDHLYNRLDGAYPHKWRSNFPGPEAIDNWKCSWAEAFEEEGITPTHVKAGLKACRSKYDWPPSCAEFIKACKPSADTTKAYYEAVYGLQARLKGNMGEWSHPAVYWAASSMAFDIANQTYSQIKDRWELVLAEQMGRNEWSDIPQPMIALPAPGKTELSKEKAKAMLDQLGASDILKPKAEHTFWYRDILAREKKGDKTLPMIQRRFAHEAAEAHGYAA